MMEATECAQADWRKLKGKMNFPSCSAVKECTCNAGDEGLIPGLGRSPGERYFRSSPLSQNVRLGSTALKLPKHMTGYLTAILKGIHSKGIEFFSGSDRKHLCNHSSNPNFFNS